MDLRRVRSSDWLAAFAGLVLLGSMFLHWYGTSNAWRAFSVVDLVLLLAALFAIAIPVASATQRSGAIPQSISTVGILPGLAAMILVVYRVLDPPGGGHREAGVWIGLAAVLALFVATYRAVADPRQPGLSTSEIEITPLPAPRPE